MRPLRAAAHARAPRGQRLVHDDPQVDAADRRDREPAGDRQQRPDARAADHQRDTRGQRDDRGASQRAVCRNVGLRHRERGAHDQEEEPDLGHRPLNRGYGHGAHTASGDPPNRARRNHP
jgi:hypothetical protein